MHNNIELKEETPGMMPEFTIDFSGDSGLETTVGVSVKFSGL